MVITLKVIVVTLCIILIANQLFHSVRHYCLITLLFNYITIFLQNSAISDLRSRNCSDLIYM